MPARSTQAAPAVTWIPAATAPPSMEAVSVMSWDRAFAVTRLISAGSRRGVTDARTTPYAFCSTRMPNAAGSSVTGLWMAADIPQQSKPRASRVPASR